MGRYRWDGGQPHITDGGQVFRPLEVYEFDKAPPFGPFTLIPDDDPAEPVEVAAPAPPPAPAVPATPIRPASPPPASLPATGTEGA
jgi:hypothetical protein